MAVYDVAIVGLGAMGGSVAMHLARRGLRVVGIDRWAPPHDRGSTHGRTRLIREAYYEDPRYVPLVRRAYELWQELEHEVEGALVRRTGSLMIGSEGSGLIDGTLRSAREHGVPHEVFEAERVHQLFPAFTPLDDMIAVYEPGSSLLDPERIVALQLEMASRAGADLVFGQRVERWDADGSRIELHTDGEPLVAHRLVLCAGAWTTSLLPAHSLPLEVERQVQYWWEPARRPELFGPDRMPVSMWEVSHDGSSELFYTMPDLGHGVKIARHHGGVTTDPDSVSRDLGPDENAAIADLLRRFMPNAKGRRCAHAVCLYTNTPDRNFVIDRLPDEERVIVVSACSGHGFKFASVIGEIVADLVTRGRSGFDLAPFRIGRWGP